MRIKDLAGRNLLPLTAAGMALLMCGLVGVPAGAGAHGTHDAAGATTAAAAAPVDPTVSAHPALAHIRPAPGFALEDTDGRTVTLDGLGRKIRIVSFIYTSCSAACPLLTERMARLQESLTDQGRAADVALVSITVDPARDDAKALSDYAARYGADRSNWSFLTGSPEQLTAALAAYDEWTRPLPGGADLDHPARLYLIDRTGTVREIYSLAFFDERQALIDVLALLAEPTS